LDGNPKNPKLSNLKYGTSKENTEDMRRHGTMLLGRRHGHNKLTESQVLTIRKSAKSDRKLAKFYNVAYATIRQIKNREIWAWLEDK